MPRTYPAHPRRSPRSFEELMERAPVAAVAVSGADHSNWSGRLLNARHLAPGAGMSGQKAAGEVGLDHSLRLDYALVQAPLRDMFRRPGRRRDPQELWGYTVALVTLFHEHVHLLSARDTSLAESGAAMSWAPVSAIEEGVTDLYSVKNLRRFIGELELKEVVPDLEKAAVGFAYRAYTPGVSALLEHAAQATGIESDEILRQLAIVNPEQKWPALARHLVAADGLDKLVPQGQGPNAYQRVRLAMRHEFGELSKLDQLDPGQQWATAVSIGDLAFVAAQAELGLIRQELATSGKVAPAVKASAISQSGLIAQQPTSNTEAPQVAVSNDAEAKRVGAEANPAAVGIGDGEVTPVAVGDGADATPVAVGNDAEAERVAVGDDAEAKPVGVGGGVDGTVVPADAAHAVALLQAGSLPPGQATAQPVDGQEHGAAAGTARTARAAAVLDGSSGGRG